MGKLTSQLMNNLTSNDNSQVNFCSLINKPVEIYVFVDPICPISWSLEPAIKKLAMEYGCYFRLRTIVSSNLPKLNLFSSANSKELAQYWDKTASRTGMSCDGDFWYEQSLSSPSLTALAIKAAELQGQRHGSKYLRKLQEFLFLNKRNISDEEVLYEIAEDVNLDVNEFKKDLHSETAKRALHNDWKITCEMEVEQLPTIVMFNRESSEDGLRISGLYDHHVYEKALFEVLDREVRPTKIPSLEDFLCYFEFVATKEVAVVYGWTMEQAEKELKKLVLKQKVKKVPVKYGTFWQYIL
ncbi:ClpXP adapter SpxH family protein [Aquisalibacillus elongatus]|uniref:ClpXP adapter protein SpxH n=1 Tax=Aquisalibacillus elongatus TaxID=485577 RepID=A0A3N5B3Y4_9BACI|nr:ClpXP adapter SpxH family protein [Aquisalibacillus elongatus]RPF52114.1 putative DsbA family dithiol-disulfide isomerase [Aquisalibacillus elongatus]